MNTKYRILRFFVIYLRRNISHSNYYIARFSLANVCRQIYTGHVVTNDSYVNEPPYCILEIQLASKYNMIDNKDISYLWKKKFWILSNIEVYMLQNNVQCLRSTLKSFIWHHKFLRHLCAKVVNNILLYLIFCNF